MKTDTPSSPTPRLIREPSVTVMAVLYSIPAFDCKLMLKMTGQNAIFFIMDDNDKLLETLDGARLYGRSGTIDIFRNGTASCPISRITNGFCVRAAGESLALISQE